MMRTVTATLMASLALAGCSESYAERVEKAKKSNLPYPTVEMTSFEEGLV
jgi:hypothetical protein